MFWKVLTASNIFFFPSKTLKHWYNLSWANGKKKPNQNNPNIWEQFWFTLCWHQYIYKEQIQDWWEAGLLRNALGWIISVIRKLVELKKRKEYKKGIRLVAKPHCQANESLYDIGWKFLPLCYGLSTVFLLWHDRRKSANSLNLPGRSVLVLFFLLLISMLLHGKYIDAYTFQLCKNLCVYSADIIVDLSSNVSYH